MEPSRNVSVVQSKSNIMKRSFRISTSAMLLIGLVSSVSMASTASNIQDRVLGLELNTAPPIQLMMFTATPNGDNVDVEWTTGGELDNDFFTVERSKDGDQWQIVEIIQGNGTSFTTILYGIKDHDPLPGTSFYRIKQTDFNGNGTYSPVVEVVRQGSANISVYPNPAQSLVSVEAENIEAMDIELHNAAGQSIPIAITRDQGKAWIALNTLPVGTYILTFQQGDLRMTEKLIIE